MGWKVSSYLQCRLEKIELFLAPSENVFFLSTSTYFLLGLVLTIKIPKVVSNYYRYFKLGAAL